MKSTMNIQFGGKTMGADALEKLVKEDIKANNKKISDIKTLNIYFKPAESAVYYVVETKSGKVYGTNNRPLYIPQ